MTPANAPTGGCKPRELLLPNGADVRHCVGLVDHANLATRVHERELDDALHAARGVDILLDCNFVVGAAPDPSAGADVRPLDVLPNDQQVDCAHVFEAQRTEPVVQQPGRA